MSNLIPGTSTTTFLVTLLVGLAVAFAAFSLTASATAELTGDNQTVSVTDPVNQSLEATLSFSGSTDATLSLLDAGTTVDSATVSGSSGATETATLELASVQNGTYEIQVSASDESVVSLDETTLITQRDAMLNMSKGDTATVDVQFDSPDEASAVVSLTESGTTTGSETLEWFTLSDGENTGVKTAEIEASANLAAANVTVETSPAMAHSQVWVQPSDDSGIIGGFGGGGDGISLPLVGGVALLVAGAYVYSETDR